MAVGVALLVVIPLGGGLYLLTSRHYDNAIEARRRAAALQNQVLETALRHQMIDKDFSLVSSILQEIGAQPDVQRAMILNHEGEIRVASDVSQVGQALSRQSATCLVCHARQPEDRELSVLLEEPSGRVLRNVLPIENRSECYECHDPAQRLNGILILDISLASLHAELKQEATWIFVGGTLLALLLLGGVGLLVRHLILKRLGGLGRTARRIAAGDLSKRAPTEGGDVIASLAGDFNHMAEAVTELVGEVRGQEAQLTSVMNSLSDGLVVLDCDTRVVACNRSFCERVESDAGGIRGRRCREATGDRLPCCASEEECLTARCAATGESQRAVFQVQTENGDVARVEEVYASPIFDGEGRVSQVVEIWRDITERVKEETRLAEIERLVSLGVLASGFSHEVNTPLASMLTCADAVVGRIDDASSGDDAGEILPSIRAHAATIREQVLRCRKITEQFLRFSRGIPPSIEPMDLHQRVEEVVALVAPTAREACVTVRVAQDGPLPAVKANAEVVQHVLLNLLVNAIQSCGDRGGVVTVGYRTAPDIRVIIQDTGCGIAPEDRRHLFEPFRSRKPQGTGLGLFLSRRSMRRFGGDVTLEESTVGEGSCFHVVFAPASVAVETS
jgi:PAS domain S-box-containing protein